MSINLSITDRSSLALSVHDKIAYKTPQADARDWGVVYDFDPSDRSWETDNSDALRRAILAASTEGTQLYIAGFAFCDEPIQIDLGDAVGFSIIGAGAYNSGFVTGQGIDGAAGMELKRTVRQRMMMRDIGFFNIIDRDDDPEIAEFLLNFRSTGEPNYETGEPSYDDEEGGMRISHYLDNLYFGRFDDVQSQCKVKTPLRIGDGRWPTCRTVIVHTHGVSDSYPEDYPRTWHDGSAGIMFEDCYYSAAISCDVVHSSGQYGIADIGNKNATERSHRDKEGCVIDRCRIPGKNQYGVFCTHTNRDSGDGRGEDGMSLKEPGLEVRDCHIHAVNSCVRVEHRQRVDITGNDFSTAIGGQGQAGQETVIDLIDAHSISVIGNKWSNGGYFNSVDDCARYLRIDDRTNHVQAIGNEIGRPGIAFYVESNPAYFLEHSNVFQQRKGANGLTQRVFQCTLRHYMSQSSKKLWLEDLSLERDSRQSPSVVSANSFDIDGVGIVGQWRQSNDIEEEDAANDPPEHITELPEGVPDDLRSAVRVTAKGFFDGPLIREAVRRSRKVEMGAYLYVTDNSANLSFRLKQKMGGQSDPYTIEIPVVSSSDTGWVNVSAVFELLTNKINPRLGGWNLGITADNAGPVDYIVALVDAERVPSDTTSGAPSVVSVGCNTPTFRGKVNWENDNVSSGLPQTISFPDVVYAGASGPTATLFLGQTDVTADATGGVSTESGGVWSTTDMVYTPVSAVDTFLKIRFDATSDDGRYNSTGRSRTILADGASAPGFIGSASWSSTDPHDVATPITSAIAISTVFPVFATANSAAQESGWDILMVDGNQEYDISHYYDEETRAFFVPENSAGKEIRLLQYAGLAGWNDAGLDPVTETAILTVLDTFETTIVVGVSSNGNLFGYGSDYGSIASDTINGEVISQIRSGNSSNPDDVWVIMDSGSAIPGNPDDVVIGIESIGYIGRLTWSGSDGAYRGQLSGFRGILADALGETVSVRIGYLPN